MNNLNLVQVENADGDPYQRQTVCYADNVTVFFDNLEARLLLEIDKADVVIGCVAWLTHPAIINALSQKQYVQIVVQKEDFLRPDLFSGKGFAAQLRAWYSQLEGCERYALPGGVSNLSYASDPSIEPVRCMGNYNKDKNPAFPRMHHKFLLFCRLERGELVDQDFTDEEIRGHDTVIPYAVWTGSFNLTKNATHSFENALLITTLEIVEAYANEYGHIVALSEPLDWEKEWIAPEYRIGT